MDYVIAVQAPAYPLSPSTFATESAFAEHLKELRRSIGPRFAKLVLLAPRLTEDQYNAKRAHLGIVNLESDEVLFVPLHETSTRAKQFWFSHARQLWRQISATVSGAGVVHSGLSDDIWRPTMAMVNLAAWRAGKPVIFVVDIDFRQHAKRNYKLGTWGTKSYVVCRLVYDPIKWLQVWFAVRLYSLVLLKSASMVRDFGRGRPNVKNFYDTVHSLDDILSESALSQRQHWLVDETTPFTLAYFGRLVSYKGLDRAIEAVRLARAQGEDVRLQLLGEGECEHDLRRQVTDSGLESIVRFHPQVAYGSPLFEQLGQAHMSIATPLVEDTPRAAFDSLARGLPIIAFDISYFRDLAQESGAVELAAWPDAAAMARGLVALSRDRRRVAAMAGRGVAFARANTQSAWLEQRACWVRDLTAASGKTTNVRP